MLVFKFGGASVKDADGVRNLSKIVRLYQNENIVIVVSAMAKTTNALEILNSEYIAKSDTTSLLLDQLKEFHFNIARQLFPNDSHPVFNILEKHFRELENFLARDPALNFDFNYDQIVSFGELLSTSIVAGYLKNEGLQAEWKDIRHSLKTDGSYREGKVDWELSGELIRKDFQFSNAQFLITQGFLGSTINNLTTTLGREGSDYSAAILAYVLDAGKVIIWKDVPGVLNADPKWFDNTELLPQLSYLDAIELAYYGASIIHPKTIQPLRNKNINLHVKSFLHPDEPGTIIGNEVYEKLVPSFIFKMDQVLINISAKDFSFIAEDNLEVIFHAFAARKLRINLMQNTAMNFKVCVNNDKTRIPGVLTILEDHFRIAVEEGLELITIRYFDNHTIDRVLVNKEPLLQQISRETIQMVVKDKG